MTLPGQRTSHRNVRLLVYKAGLDRAALAKLLVVLRYEATFSTGEDAPLGSNWGTQKWEVHGPWFKMGDPEMGSPRACTCHPRPGESLKAALPTESPKPRLQRDLRHHIARAEHP